MPGHRHKVWRPERVPATVRVRVAGRRRAALAQAPQGPQHLGLHRVSCAPGRPSGSRTDLACLSFLGAMLGARASERLCCPEGKQHNPEVGPPVMGGEDNAQAPNRQVLFADAGGVSHIYGVCLNEWC